MTLSLETLKIVWKWANATP